ncbi:MAG: hypothetical protein ACI88A_002376 [Paraglaciecola sp.]|jgi:hypothetical protein
MAASGNHQRSEIFSLTEKVLLIFAISTAFVLGYNAYFLHFQQ